MRKMAGFTTGNHMNYNPRTTVKPPDSLIEKTPFHRFSTPLEYVEAKIQNDGADVWTAYEFLKLMKLLAVVFLQDAAAIWVLHPERKEHPMFSMPVFQDPEWLVSILCVFAARVVLFVYFILCVLFYFIFIFRVCTVCSEWLVSILWVFFILRARVVLFVYFILCVLYVLYILFCACYFILFYFIVLCVFLLFVMF
jgi:hypothetical protein